MKGLVRILFGRSFCVDQAQAWFGIGDMHMECVNDRYNYAVVHAARRNVYDADRRAMFWLTGAFVRVRRFK